MELILILYATNILYWIPILAHFSKNFDFVPFITSRDTRPTAANPLHAAAAVDRWDGRTDTVQLYTEWAKKRGHRLMTVILPILDRFKNFFSLEDFLVNLQLNGYQKSQHTLHMLLHYLVKASFIASLSLNIFCTTFYMRFMNTLTTHTHTHTPV